MHRFRCTGISIIRSTLISVEKCVVGEIIGPPIFSKEFKEGIKKVGPGCDFTYPMSKEELEWLDKKDGSGKTKDRILIIVAGPNGSGKSSTIKNTDVYNKGIMILNPDNYVKILTNIDDLKDRYLYAMKQYGMLREIFIKNGISFGIETIASTDEKLNYVKKAKDSGYQINLIYVNAGSPEKCCERIKERVSMGGHDVPREKVFSRYERTLSYLHEYVQIADVAVVFDNSTDQLITVLEKIDDEITITDFGKTCEWSKKYILPFLKEEK